MSSLRSDPEIESTLKDYERAMGAWVTAKTKDRPVNDPHNLRMIAVTATSMGVMDVEKRLHAIVAQRGGTKEQADELLITRQNNVEEIKD